MDNHLCAPAPDLYAMLKTQCKIPACGSLCTNRKGWDQSMMNFHKSSNRIEKTVYHNLINGNLLSQQKANNVVSFISTLPLVDNRNTPCQCGNKKVEFSGL